MDQKSGELPDQALFRYFIPRVYCSICNSDLHDYSHCHFVCTRLQCRSMTQYAHHMDTCPYVKYIHMMNSILSTGLVQMGFMPGMSSPPLPMYPTMQMIPPTLSILSKESVKPSNPDDKSDHKYDRERYDDLERYKYRGKSDKYDKYDKRVEYKRIYCSLCDSYTHDTDLCKYRCYRSKCVRLKYHLHSDHKYDIIDYKKRYCTICKKEGHPSLYCQKKCYCERCTHHDQVYHRNDCPYAKELE